MPKKSWYLSFSLSLSFPLSPSFVLSLSLSFSLPLSLRSLVQAGMREGRRYWVTQKVPQIYILQIAQPSQYGYAKLENRFAVTSGSLSKHWMTGPGNSSILSLSFFRSLAPFVSLFLGWGRFKRGEEVNIGWQDQEMPKNKYISLSFVLSLSLSPYSWTQAGLKRGVKKWMTGPGNAKK